MKKIMIFLFLTIASHANADSVWSEWHGNTKPEDYAHLFPQSFFIKYPSDKWAIFVNSSSFRLGTIFACYADVGVVPRGLHQFPAHAYSSARSHTYSELDEMVGEQRKFEAECVKFAINNMLSDDINVIYRSYK